MSSGSVFDRAAPEEKEREGTMEGTIKQLCPGYADGFYQLKARGFLAASLYWADENGPLPNWTSFAHFPIEPNGVGSYHMTGGRAVPDEATHVLMKAVSSDLETISAVLVPIPMPGNLPPKEPVQRFLVLSDLHLSSKPWQIRKALSMGKEWDGVLIPGDITNDGTPEQFMRFWQCVTEVIPQTPVFAVAGNHDYPVLPLPQICQGIGDYPALQQALLDRAANLGISCHADSSGAYCAILGDTEIFGLNAVTHWRKFRFPESAQLEWLANRLNHSRAKNRIILCHAPLANHRPYHQPGDPPYLHLDKKLQGILDSQRDILFLSGHTHVSLNCQSGCIERDSIGNLYINTGSIRPTTLKPEQPLQPSSWTEGNAIELEIRESHICVKGISIKTGQYISRGYYRFPK